METHATTKKSLMGRLKNLVHKEKPSDANMVGIAMDMAKKEVDAGKKVVYVAQENEPSTQSPITDADVEAKLKEVKEVFPVRHGRIESKSVSATGGGSSSMTLPKASDDEGHVHTAACKHSHKAKSAKSKKMRDLFPGYEGQKFTPKSPSKATLEQKRQKKARRLARLGRK